VRACTSARPAGPRNPNRSPLSVRVLSPSPSLSLSLSLSLHRSLPPSQRPFAHRLGGNDLGAVPAVSADRPSTISHVDVSIGAAGRVVNYFARPGRSVRDNLHGDALSFRTARVIMILRPLDRRSASRLGVRVASRSSCIFPGARTLSGNTKDPR